MTLAELLPEIQHLPVADKLKLIRVLAEDLDTREDIPPLNSDTMYYVATPYDVTGVACGLLDALENDERNRH